MSMKYRISALLFSILLISSVFVVFTVNETYAASKKVQMTAYNTIKKGDTVYCTNGFQIYKVDLKTERVTELKSPIYHYPESLKLKGKYLYCFGASQDAAQCNIFRVNVKTNKYKVLSKRATQDYAIKGSNIYYCAVQWKTGKLIYHNKVMKLNGKSKRETKIKAKLKFKETSNTNYYVESGESYFDANDWIRTPWYLETPKGSIYLGDKIGID